jgi:hypothetical protein
MSHIPCIKMLQRNQQHRDFSHHKTTCDGESLNPRIMPPSITEIMFTNIFMSRQSEAKKKEIFIACLERETFPRYESHQNATNVRQPAGVINHDLLRVIPLNALLSFFPAMDCCLVLVRRFL